MSDEHLNLLLGRLERLEEMVRLLVEQRTLKDWYSTSEAAELLHKSEYTVREWCRLGRVRAKKREYTRGPHPEWLISHEELERIRNEGLLPLSRTLPR